MVERLGVGSRVYHLTDHLNLSSICGQGLQPRTPAPMGMYVKMHFDEIPLSRGFIVCSATEDFSDWKKFEVFEELYFYVLKNASSRILKLSFILEDVSDCFVLEHAYSSPKRFVDLCGEDLWTRVKKHELLNRDQEQLYLKQLDLYDSSAISLRDYKGNYQLPELWIPHTTPFDKLTIEEVMLK